MELQKLWSRNLRAEGGVRTAWLVKMQASPLSHPGATALLVSKHPSLQAAGARFCRPTGSLTKAFLLQRGTAALLGNESTEYTIY